MSAGSTQGVGPWLCGNVRVLVAPGEVSRCLTLINFKLWLTPFIELFCETRESSCQR